MSRVLASLAWFTSLLSRISLWFSGLGLVVMTVIIGWQIWGRYVLNDTPKWSERLSLYLMIYYIMFAAAVGVRERFHIGLVIFQDAAPRRLGIFLRILTHVAVGAFGVAMVRYGANLAEMMWLHTIPTLGVSTGTSYLPFPVAGVLIALFSLEHILWILSGRER